MLKHLVSTRQVNTEVLETILAEAAALEAQYRENKLPKPLTDKAIATLFYEPSTRTRFSFEMATQRLGGLIISTESAAQFSSAAKGETPEDSIRVISGYVDGIVIRHPAKGIAAQVAEVSEVPIINAGDGNGEHPTQALLDAYTIKKDLGRLDSLRVTMVGDILNGRTIHSLLYLLALYPDNRIRLVSPPQLRLPAETIVSIAGNFTDITEHETLDDVLPYTDVLYVTRVQEERFKEMGLEQEYEQLKDCYIVNASSLDHLNADAIIMHPLPRLNEIATEVDADPRAAYFRQAKNGLFARMALLKLLLT